MCTLISRKVHLRFVNSMREYAKRTRKGNPSRCKISFLTACELYEELILQFPLDKIEAVGVALEKGPQAMNNYCGIELIVDMESDSDEFCFE